AAPADGIAQQLSDLLNNYTSFNGLLDNRTQGIQTSLDQLTTQQNQLNQRLSDYQATLTAQFTAMDNLVAQLQSTGNFLTQQINTLNGSSILAQSTAKSGS